MLNLSSAQKSDLRIKSIQNKCISKIPMKCCPMTSLHLHQCPSHIDNIHIVVFFFHLTFTFCCLHRFYHLKLFVFLHVSVFYYFTFRSDLFTNILLVLVISITCVQTKEIKNSSVFSEISESNHSSIENSSISNYRPNNNAHDNHIRSSNNSAHVLTTHPSTNATPSSDEKTIDIQQSSLLTNAQNIHSNQYSNQTNDPTEIIYANELGKFELPTAIEKESQLNNNIQSEQTTQRYGKDSDLLKSALRVAARQGLEAMVELYNKKEPNLIRKGQLIF